MTRIPQCRLRELRETGDAALKATRRRDTYADATERFGAIDAAPLDCPRGDCARPASRRRRRSNFRTAAARLNSRSMRRSMLFGVMGGDPDSNANGRNSDATELGRDATVRNRDATGTTERSTDATGTLRSDTRRDGTDSLDATLRNWTRTLRGVRARLDGASGNSGDEELRMISIITSPSAPHSMFPSRSANRA